MRNLILIFFTFFSIYHAGVNAQEIPTLEVITPKNLKIYLKDEVVKDLGGEAAITEDHLAKYFRKKFSERYFYDWQNFYSRFLKYDSLYPGIEVQHRQRALDNLSKYSGSTTWKLPFNYTNGKPVNAYALRHLARQHKMVDIVFFYHFQQKNPVYLNYFKEQLKSLNKALHNNEYETIEDGNGIYEAFRSGYRVLNWLQIHNMLLGEEQYSNEDQLLTIATLLQHGQHLYENNQEFNPGNHQTRGMSALAMLGILLRDVKGTDKWYQRAMELLKQHLSTEINSDGFQSERTVHYHMSDIKNYFYVYQLALNSDFPVDEVWENKLKSLFTTLAKIAYPDGSAPVFSDDTDAPWAEKNDISGAMTLGYLLFKNPEFGFFASQTVDKDMYWYLSEDQLSLLNNIEKKKPEIKSMGLEETGYYIMREGWDKNDKMMAISAGLDEEKPDHQHGDMLGIQAMANTHVILPNYQVRYYLEDLELFKNSLVKNVALVDEVLQGKDYRSNKGGSGFGKFGSLPEPTVLAFKSTPSLDLFIGKHNGFEEIGVDYIRKVIYVKDDFWIVKDQFFSTGRHNYKQVWQGHYTTEKGPYLLRATFVNGSGLDIYQLRNVDSVSTSGTRGKEWSILESETDGDHEYLTVLFPFAKFDSRIDEKSEIPQFYGWQLNSSNWNVKGEGNIVFTNGEQGLFFSVKEIEKDNLKIGFEKKSDFYLGQEEGKLVLTSLSAIELEITISSGLNEFRTESIKPGSRVIIN